MTATVVPAELHTDGRRPAWRDREPWKRPPGWCFYAFLVPGALALLVGASDPSGDTLLLVGFAYLFLAAIVWLVRATLFVIGSFVEHSAAGWPMVAIAPLAGLVVIGLVYAGAPIQGRWLVGRDALDRSADRLELAAADHDVAEWHAPPTEGLRIGTFRVTDRFARHGDEYFTTGGCGFFATCGLARLSSGPPRPTSTSWTYHHLSGDWYSWTNNVD